jgi:XTP/dITP diphosphohydrolase
VREIAALLGGAGVQLLSLRDYPAVPEIEEDGSTFLENACKKACIVAALTGEAALADDSGIEVAWLGGAPGIYSSRFSGPEATDATNIAALLEKMRGVPRVRRGAAFRCVLVFCRPDGSWEQFTGALRGEITEAPAGSGGFGYDPVFYVPEYDCTVAQLRAEVKNRISHRGRAVEAFKLYLQRELLHLHGA